MVQQRGCPKSAFGVYAKCVFVPNPTLGCCDQVTKSRKCFLGHQYVEQSPKTHFRHPFWDFLALRGDHNSCSVPVKCLPLDGPAVKCFCVDGGSLRFAGQREKLKFSFLDGVPAGSKTPVRAAADSIESGVILQARDRYNYFMRKDDGVSCLVWL